MRTLRTVVSGVIEVVIEVVYGWTGPCFALDSGLDGIWDTAELGDYMPWLAPWTLRALCATRP